MTKHISAKSFLIAQKTESFLCNTTSFDPKSAVKFARAWQKSDEKAAKDLLQKNAQNYYSTIVCTANCYEVCSKLDAIRESQFGGVNSLKRGKRGKRLCDATAKNGNFVIDDENDANAPNMMMTNAAVNVITPPSEKTPRLPGLATPRDEPIKTSLFNSQNNVSEGEGEGEGESESGSESEIEGDDQSDSDSLGDKNKKLINDDLLRGSYSDHIVGADSLFFMENNNRESYENLNRLAQQVVEEEEVTDILSSDPVPLAEAVSISPAKQRVQKKARKQLKKKKTKKVLVLKTGEKVATTTKTSGTTASSGTTKEMTSAKMEPVPPPAPPQPFSSSNKRDPKAVKKQSNLANPKTKPPSQVPPPKKIPPKQQHQLQLQLQQHQSSLSSIEHSENTSLVSILNEKCAALVQSEHDIAFTTKKRMDAEEQAHIVSRKYEQVDAELGREQQRCKIARKDASKYKTELQAANETIERLKIYLEESQKAEEETRSNYREATGKAAEIDAHLLSEKEKSKQLRKRCDELKSALRKLAALKESGEYKSSSEQIGSATKSSDDPKSNELIDKQEMEKLENENSYLRKQIKSEIQCKKDLKSALDNQTERLKHARMLLAEKERENLKEKERGEDHLEDDENAAKEEGTSESTSLNSLGALRAENSSLNQQLSEVRECYAASRENLQITQRALETARDTAEKAAVDATNANLQLSSCREEVKRKELANEDVKRLFSNQLAESELKLRRAEEELDGYKGNNQLSQKKRLSVVKVALLFHKKLAPSSLGVSLAFYRWGRNSSLSSVVDMKQSLNSMGTNLLTARSEHESTMETFRKKVELEVSTARRQANACVQKSVEKGRKEVEAAEKEKAYLRKRAEASATKLLTAKGDHDLMKKRILELQTELKGANQVYESKAEELAAATASLEEKQKIVEEKEKEISSLVLKVREGDSNHSIEVERALLSCERRLREESDKELKECEKVWRSRIEKVEEDMRRVRVEGEEKVKEVEAKLEGKIELKVKESDERMKEKDWEVGVAREKERRAKEEFESQLKNLKSEHALEIASLKSTHEEVKLALKTVREEMAMEMNDRDKKATMNLRKSVGEERARACRAMQRAREEFGEKEKVLHCEEKRLKEEMARLEEVGNDKAEIYKKKIEKMKVDMKKEIDEIEAKNLNAVKKEAKKWEAVVEEMEAARIEEVRALAETSRSNSETTRKQIGDAAKRAIEEARERWQKCAEELEKVKAKAKEVKREDEGRLREAEKHRERVEKAAIAAERSREKMKEQLDDLKGAKGDLEEKVESLRMEHEIEVRKIKGEWALKSERVQVLVCEKESREKVMGDLREKEEAMGKRILALEKDLEEGRKDWEGEKKVWGDQIKSWKLRGYEWGEEKRALDATCLKLKSEIEEVKKDREVVIGQIQRQGSVELEGLRKEMENEVARRVKACKESTIIESGREWEKKIEAVALELVGVREEKNEMMEKMNARLKVEVKLAERRGEEKGEDIGNGRVAEVERELGEMRRNLADCRDNLCCMVERHEQMVGSITDLVETWEKGGLVEREERGERKEEEGGGLTDLKSKLSKIDEKLSKEMNKCREVEIMAREADAKVKEHNSGVEGALSPGGGLSMAHVKKGRRLNEDLEDCLGRVQGIRKVVMSLKEKKGEVMEEIVKFEEKRGQSDAEKYGKVLKECEMLGSLLQQIASLCCNVAK